MHHPFHSTLLLLGGTSETATLAEALAQAGHRVLVSTATDEPLPIGDHPGIQRRCGRLDAGAMARFITENSIIAIVDAAHPYAEALHQTATVAAATCGIPCLLLQRPASLCGAPDDAACRFVATHEEAAALAASFGVPILLTTGSNHLEPYVRHAREQGVPLVARVLDAKASLQACADAGLNAAQIIAGRGPFDVATNRQHIRQFGIGVLVTKDSGAAGGVPEKLTAAKQEQIPVIIVCRPPQTDGAAERFYHLPELLARVAQLL